MWIDEMMTVEMLIAELQKVKDKSIPVTVDGDDGKGMALSGCVYDGTELDSFEPAQFIIHFESGNPTEREEEDEEDDPSIDLAYDRWRDDQLYGEKM